uniref:Uncharacterized protein n=1 Tax=Avena sativa TaxID=4498 RepID=A0ACD5VCX2_AVESA
MNIVLVAALVICFVSHETDTATAWNDQDFFRNCPPSRCNKDGPEIRFPLRLDSSNTSSSCGATCAKLACSGQDTIMLHPFLGPCIVTAINYTGATLNITPLTSACTMIQKFISTNPLLADTGHCCTLHYSRTGKLVGCLREFTPSGITDFPVYDDRGSYYASVSAADTIAGPLPCLSNTTYFSYLVDAYAYMYDLPLGCKVISDAAIPVFGIGYDGSTTKKVGEGTTLRFYDIAANWSEPEPSSVPYQCQKCEQNGQRCAFSSQRNITFCLSQPHKGTMNF